MCVGLPLTVKTSSPHPLRPWLYLEREFFCVLFFKKRKPTGSAQERKKEITNAVSVPLLFAVPMPCRSQKLGVKVSDTSSVGPHDKLYLLQAKINPVGVESTLTSRNQTSGFDYSLTVSSRSRKVTPPSWFFFPYLATERPSAELAERLPQGLEVHDAGEPVVADIHLAAPRQAAVVVFVRGDADAVVLRGPPPVRRREKKILPGVLPRGGMALHVSDRPDVSARETPGVLR